MHVKVDIDIAGIDGLTSAPLIAAGDTDFVVQLCNQGLAVEQTFLALVAICADGRVDIDFARVTDRYKLIHREGGGHHRSSNDHHVTVDLSAFDCRTRDNGDPPCGDNAVLHPAVAVDGHGILAGNRRAGDGDARVHHYFGVDEAVDGELRGTLFIVAVEGQRAVL